ncbi:MAG: membrane-associated phospholipid phosphatase [Crocinitomix sp.]|jgi:membrane-associated phospholipid phosphatase
MIARQFFISLSYIFHPIFMPLLGLYFLFSLETRPLSLYKLDALFYFPSEAKNFLYVIIGILTIVAPLLSLLIMYYNKMISSLSLEKKEERTYPFVLVSFYYLLAYIYVRTKIPIELQHPALVGFLFGVLLIFVISFVVNFYIKISLHAAAIFGVAGMLLGYSQTQLSGFEEGSPTNLYIILYFLFVAGLVSGARLFLKAHSLTEILLGSAVGFFVMYIVVKYGLYL